MGLTARYVIETSRLTLGRQAWELSAMSSETNKLLDPQITMKGNQGPYPIFNGVWKCRREGAIAGNLPKKGV